MSTPGTDRAGAPAAGAAAGLGNAGIQELEARYSSGFYPKRPLALSHGAGARVWDADGREYLDCVGGHGAANLGHAHPEVVAAIREQAGRLLLCPEAFHNEQRARLQEKLVQSAPPGINRVFLCNSGTEAVEAALKLARLATGRRGFVAARRGFHGRTMGALSATWEPKYREPFEPLVPGFVHVPYDDLEALDACVDGDIAAVILEIVQGEGGVRPGTAEFLRGAQALCRERGALLILDEIQTGMGRTGRLWASEHHGLQPDLLVAAKSLAGGVPMGTALIGERLPAIAPLTHGSTFGGNPLACAASLAALGALEAEKLCERAARLGAHALARLSALDTRRIREVRGMGLMLGVELRERVTPILMALMERGVLALPAGPTVLRLLPPLVITDEELDRVLDTVAEVLERPA